MSNRCAQCSAWATALTERVLACLHWQLSSFSNPCVGHFLGHNNLDDPHHKWVILNITLNVPKT